MTINRLLFIALSLIALALFARLWVGTGSYPEIWDLKAQIREQTLENQQLLARNAQLEVDVLGLGEDDAAIEEHARSELGMIKENEMFYQVVLTEEVSHLRQLPEASSANVD